MAPLPTQGAGPSGSPGLMYLPASATLTPSMAIRAGATFAGAPMMQGAYAGSGTPDTLTFGRGNQVVSNWYGTFDPYQGGGFCIWTPENSSGTRTGEAFLWYGASYSLRYDYLNSRYRIIFGSQLHNIDVVITAGTREFLAWGYDTKGKLDGANYAFFSRNDTQTYIITTQPTAAAVDATILVGYAAGLYPLNGLIEGLVFTRSIPWTGAYGHNIWGGTDIVAAHYAAGAGADICTVIGSWDVTFMLPTAGTPGALVTG